MIMKTFLFLAPFTAIAHYNSLFSVTQNSLNDFCWGGCLVIFAIFAIFSLCFLIMCIRMKCWNLLISVLGMSIFFLVIIILMLNKIYHFNTNTFNLLLLSFFTSIAMIILPSNSQEHLK